MATSQKEDSIEFFAKESNYSSAKEDFQNNTSNKKQGILKKFIFLLVLSIFVVGVGYSFLNGTNGASGDGVVAQEKVPLPEDRFKVEMPGGYFPAPEARINTDLDTAKTPAVKAREHADKKLRELAGTVDNYGPSLLKSQ